MAGFGRGSVSNLTNNVVSRFSDNQKTVYDQLVSGGVDKSYSAVVVSQWEKSFKQQPMQYIQNVMAQKVSTGLLTCAVPLCENSNQFF